METATLTAYREVFPEKKEDLEKDDFERLQIIETVRNNQIINGNQPISIDDAIEAANKDEISGFEEAYVNTLLAAREMRDWYCQVDSTIQEGRERIMPFLVKAEMDSVLYCLTECLTVLDLCRKNEYEQLMEQAKNTPLKIRTKAVYATVEYLRKSSNHNVVEFANEELAKYEFELKESLMDALEPQPNKKASRKRIERAVTNLMATQKPKLKTYAIEQLRLSSYAYQ